MYPTTKSLRIGKLFASVSLVSLGFAVACSAPPSNKEATGTSAAALDLGCTAATSCPYGWNDTTPQLDITCPSIAGASLFFYQADENYTQYGESWPWLVESQRLTFSAQTSTYGGYIFVCYDVPGASVIDPDNLGTCQQFSLAWGAPVDGGWCYTGSSSSSGGGGKGGGGGCRGGTCQ